MTKSEYALNQSENFCITFCPMSTKISLHELSSNGVWSFSDPKLATKEPGKEKVDQMVETAMKFIEA